ncbi:amino acid ABC transporter membrane protein 2 (PAAT family) [Breoghania corrubedonensis]|uniref:Amino acid ABC transporter membrane protein 2 (PAAT family) n=1 Tax=Breoghania corrubedonensis TaxID=665038 RepID=A0A2T5V8Y0_9HYPH|nr:ABC transporter permease [Breoghania corrubedonensis]PTW60208.1 amino acid ABC transporter membrane protein 2 (PAAT family) [Breoghania corrubedonensis]
MDFPFFLETAQTLAAGVPSTLILGLLSTAFGIVLAIGLAVLRLWGPRWSSLLARGYVFVFRGTPLLVQMFLIYYGLGQFEAVRHSFLWPVLREPFWCAILSLSLNTGAYGSEIVRGAFLAVPFGQIEAAKACGMSTSLAFRRILLPQAVRHALPAYGNELILLVKATSLASVITLMEITGVAARLISETYRVVEVFIVAGAYYLVINFVLTRIVAFAEHRLTAHLRARPATGRATAAAPDDVVPLAPGDRA